MLLGGFSLELLVDGKLLKEYNESVDKRTVHIYSILIFFKFKFIIFFLFNFYNIFEYY